MWKNYSLGKVILASQSPRRADLLRALDIDFEIAIPIHLEEKYPLDIDKKEGPLYLAKMKLDAYKSLYRANDIIIAADTIVLLNDKVLGKPKDKAEALQFLSLLSNNTHRVITGVVIAKGDEIISFTDESIVQFNELSTADINYYIDNYNPFDKAGSYGVQDWIGMRAIRSINGSYYNVMGLPIDKVAHHLDKLIK